MLRIHCPWCGPRDEPEFLCGGAAGISRPDANASDAQWAHYLFYRDNPKGQYRERWRHAFGCGQWFEVIRNTLNHEIVAIWSGETTS